MVQILKGQKLLQWKVSLLPTPVPQSPRSPGGLLLMSVLPSFSTSLFSPPSPYLPSTSSILHLPLSFLPFSFFLSEMVAYYT